MVRVVAMPLFASPPLRTATPWSPRLQARAIVILGAVPTRHAMTRDPTGTSKRPFDKAALIRL